jgi:hypothetical protein
VEQMLLQLSGHQRLPIGFPGGWFAEKTEYISQSQSLKYLNKYRGGQKMASLFVDISQRSQGHGQKLPGQLKNRSGLSS